MIDSVIKWHGGKTQLAQKHISLFPDHIHYVEPYFGGGSVLCAKPEHLIQDHSEVVNDINSTLIDFWRVLQDIHFFYQFQEQVEATPFSETMFEEAKHPNTLDTVENAVAFFVRNRQSRQGLMTDFATLSRTRTRRGMNEQVSSWLTAIDGLADLHSRLKRVVILNRPALDVIKQQDGPETFFYLDPPYLHETRVSKDAYEFEMTTNDHQELLQVLAGIEGRFMLCGYPSDLYDSVAKSCGWCTVEFDVPLNSSSKSVKEKKIERCWMNY